MKKIIALVVAILMIASMSVVAFAAEAPIETVYGDDDASNTVNNIELRYGVAQTYTVTIPENINFTNSLTDNARTISVADAIIAKNERIDISILSANNWKLVDYETANVEGSTASNVSDPVDYWFSEQTGTTVDVDDDRFTYTYNGSNAVLSVNPVTGNINTDGASGTKTIYFSTRGTGQEGTFLDYLTFVVDVVVVNN